MLPTHDARGSILPTRGARSYIYAPTRDAGGSMLLPTTRDTRGYMLPSRDASGFMFLARDGRGYMPPIRDARGYTLPTVVVMQDVPCSPLTTQWDLWSPLAVQGNHDA